MILVKITNFSIKFHRTCNFLCRICFIREIYTSVKIFAGGNEGIILTDACSQHRIMRIMPVKRGEQVEVCHHFLDDG